MVIQLNRASLKKECWEPIIAEHATRAVPIVPARVVVDIRVDSEGRAAGIEMSEPDRYPGLANCVGERIRRWQFPPSCGTAIKVPFAFAAIPAE
jgi:hypothetical protein